MTYDPVADWTDNGAVRADYDEVFQMGFRSGWAAALLAVQIEHDKKGVIVCVDSINFGTS